MNTNTIGTQWTAIANDPVRLQRVLALRGCLVGIGCSNHRAPFAPYEVVAPALNTFAGSDIMSRSLYDLIVYNLVHDEPVLSSLVVSVGEKSDGLPSEGYWTAITDLFGVTVPLADRHSFWWKEFYKARMWLRAQLKQSTRNTTGKLV